jgi:beta-glucanase (GH16 family)
MFKQYVALTTSVLLIGLTGCVTNVNAADNMRFVITSTPRPVNTPIFSDEFNDNALDANVWTTCFHWHQKINGKVTCAAEGHLELMQPENVTQQSGTLRLRAQPQSIQAYGKTFGYTSGMITTFDSFNFQYGRVEARVRMPRGRGILAAVWLMPIDKTWPPEIDVVEVLGHEPNTAHFTVHFPKDGQKWQDAYEGRALSTFDLSKSYNVYSVEWTPEKITWYLNGVKTHESTEVPHEKMYLLMTLKIGGHWAGPPDTSTQWPADMNIDYVRVYAHK